MGQVEKRKTVPNSPRKATAKDAWEPKIDKPSAHQEASKMVSQ